MIRIGANSIRNERVDRDIAESDRRLLINAYIWQNCCARGSRRWLHVGDSGDVHCIACGRGGGIITDVGTI